MNKPVPRRTVARTAYDKESHFVGVDLHVESRQEMGPLIAALDLQHFAQVWKHRGKHYLHGPSWPMLAGPKPPNGPSDAVLRCAKRLKQLRGAAKTVWNRATVRELDIGIVCGSEPTVGEWTVSAEALQAAAGVGAQIRITVYPYSPSGVLKRQPPNR